MICESPSLWFPYMYTSYHSIPQNPFELLTPMHEGVEDHAKRRNPSGSGLGFRCRVGFRFKV